MMMIITFGAAVNHRHHSTGIKNDRATVVAKCRLHLANQLVTHPLPCFQVVEATNHQVELFIETFQYYQQ